jgi:hypothetical protein
MALMLYGKGVNLLPGLSDLNLRMANLEVVGEREVESVRG